MRTMKALVKSRPEPGLWLEDVPVPEVGPTDVRIQVLRTGICGTDLHIHRWDAWAQRTLRLPLVIGHEFVGRVDTVGAHVQGFAPGDIVSGEGHVVCGHCRNCMAGRRHLCDRARGLGVHRPGAFAEYVVLPQTNVWYHAPGIPRDVQAIFDPLGNAVHTALHFDVLGEDVLITGAGPIGLMACAVVRYAGARHVVVTDVNPARLALARQMGATLALDARTERVSEAMRTLGMKGGFDVGLEMSGQPEAFHELLASMFHGGKVAMLGLPAQDIAIDWSRVVHNMLTIQGIYGRQMYETWYKMTALVQGGLDVSPVITHRLPFEGFSEGFAALARGEAAKVILEWAPG